MNKLVPVSSRKGVFEPFSSDEFSHAVGSATIKLKARDDTMQLMDSGDRTGFGVWGSALVLAKLLEDEPALRKRLAGAAVAELGSGSGLVGLSCAALGARSVTLTDRVAERNICVSLPAPPATA